MSGGAACPGFPDRVRVAGAQAGIAADATPAARGLKAGSGALGDQCAFELSNCPKHLEGEHALRRCGVDRIAQAAEMRAAGFELFDDGQQVADRAGKAIEPDHDESLARPDFAQQAGEHRAAAIGAGGVLLEDRVATGRLQLVALRVGALLVG